MTNITATVTKTKKRVVRFKYFNPNPKSRYNRDGTPCKWHIGDCSTRALCGALGHSWYTVFDLQCAKARERCCETNDMRVIEAILKDFGFEAITIKVERGMKRPTVREIAKKYKDYTGLARVSKHAVCIQGGKYHDVWDCGSKAVYKLFVKKL